jgi:hypothetical protein
VTDQSCMDNGYTHYDPATAEDAIVSMDTAPCCATSCDSASADDFCDTAGADWAWPRAAQCTGTGDENGAACALTDDESACESETGDCAYRPITAAACMSPTTQMACAADDTDCICYADDTTTPLAEWDACDPDDDQCDPDENLSCQETDTSGVFQCMSAPLGENDACNLDDDQCGDGLSCQYYDLDDYLCMHSGDEETTLECQHPGDHQGYSVDYDNSNLVSDQFDVQVSCDEGYLGTAEASVCTSWHDSEYTLTGCNEIVMCQQPEDTSGYEVLQLASEQLDNTNGDFAVAAQCADGYEGSASAVACTSSGDYTLEGCAEIVTCTSPGDTTGYEITAETSFLASDFAISAECATGYEGTATAVPCTQNGAEYTLSGCELVCFEDSMCTFTCDLETNRCEMPSICWAEYADYSVGAREDSLDWVTSYDGSVASCATLSDTICSQAGCTADAETMAASGVCLGPDSSR